MAASKTARRERVPEDGERREAQTLVVEINRRSSPPDRRQVDVRDLRLEFTDEIQDFALLASKQVLRVVTNLDSVNLIRVGCKRFCRRTTPCPSKAARRLVTVLPNPD